MSKVYIVDYYVTNFLGRDMHTVVEIRNVIDLKAVLDKFARVSPTVVSIKSYDELVDNG